MEQDALADIATPEAVAEWLRDYGLDDLSEVFQARGWHGDALLDADEIELEAVAGPARIRLLRRMLSPLRQLRFIAEPALTRAELDQPADDCRQLGQDWTAQLWLAAVLETWPGPIAHEIHMLGELLKRGKVVGALIQMRDAAEVLIKVPAVILARDLLEHGASPEIQEKIRRTFFTTDLSMGTWLGLVRDLSRAGISAADRDNVLFAPAAAALFADRKGKLTPLHDSLDAQAARRNWDLGHGAFRFDQGEIVATLRHFLLGDLPAERWARLGLKRVTTLADGLRFALTVGCWDHLALKIEGPDGGGPLVGWHSIRDYHDGALPAGHEERTAAVLAVRPDNTESLRLAPYLAARSCGLCGHQDVFVFNGWDRKHRYDLLDYMMGHRMRRSWHQVSDLYQESQRQPLPSETPLTSTDRGFSLTRGSVVALLDDAAFDKRYLSPDYLRRPLHDFLTREPRGVFWLRAPGHIGKSMFVFGLAEAETAEEKALLEDLKVAAVFIKKEYRYGPAQMAPLLESSLKQALDLAERPDRRLPQIDLEAADKPAELARFLAEYRALAGFRGKLLIGLDGLDELRPPDAKGSVLDFVPAPEQLPENTFLLLTSRSRADKACPSWVWQRLAGRLEGRPGFRDHDVNLDDIGYRRLLRHYFDREMGEARAKAEGQLIEAGVEPAAARRDAAARFDRLFEALLGKAEGLFLYVAFLIDRLKEQDLALDEIEALPEREALFTAFLDGLPDALAPKQAELAKAVLLTLAAVEQTHTWYIEGREPPFAVEPEWRGIPLGTLADLVHCQSAEGELVYILFRLKSALGSWRGEAAPAARYRLGVKGLTEAIAQHATLGPALRATHQRLAQEVLALLAPAPDTGEKQETSDSVSSKQSAALPSIDPIRLQYALAHGALSGNEALADEVANNNGLQRHLFTAFQDAYHRSRFENATRWSTLIIISQSEPSTVSQSAPNRNNLAGAYMNRGVTRGAGSDLKGALEDYGRAIELRETLRRQLGEEWPATWANDLAAAYMNRGNARGDGSDLKGALEDYGRAIELRETLRRQLGEEWPATWANDLAAAYMNRGNARGAGSDLKGALEDYGRAIELRETLRRQLGEEWPATWANDLAAAYMNRGNARGAGSDLKGALEDYGRAIELRETLRRQLGEEWPATWANDLAAAYMNRGNARGAGSDLKGALEDYGRAIELMETLRRQLGEEWPATWANDLAGAYMNRGNARGAGSDLKGALEDYGRAIELRETLRRQLGEEWPATWANDLAGAYMNRGNARGDGSDLKGALEDYGRAIELRETLRRQLGEEWPATWANDLAAAYMNRGNARRAGSDLKGALEDYGRAIELRETLRRQLGEEWPATWANDLAAAYMNRGNARGDGSDLKGALEDYGRAIELRETLRRQLGEEWPATWANDLAAAYINRGIALRDLDRLEAAVTDWSRATEILGGITAFGIASAGTRLLQALVLKCMALHQQENWVETAQALLEFLVARQQLQSQWPAEQAAEDAPWHGMVVAFTQWAHRLDPDERAALLEALGGHAEAVKKTFGWEDQESPRHQEP